MRILRPTQAQVQLPVCVTMAGMEHQTAACSAMVTASPAMEGLQTTV
jgi:hypothetical protein